MRRKIKERNIRKIYKKSGSYSVTIPMEIAKDLKIKKGQKVVVKKRGQNIVISDWKK